MAGAGPVQSPGLAPWTGGVIMADRNAPEDTTGPARLADGGVIGGRASGQVPGAVTADVHPPPEWGPRHYRVDGAGRHHEVPRPGEE